MNKFLLKYIFYTYINNNIIMPPTYAQNKVHIYKWRENNRDAMREINRKSTLKYYIWKRIQKEFLNILIN